MEPVRGHERSVRAEQGRYLVLVGLELVEGPFESGVLIAGVLQLNHSQGQAVDEQHHVRASIVAVLNHRVLVEKETDIRLRSVVSDHESVIELKLADRRSARDLRDTICEQLVKKYMAAENRRSGCLLVTLAKTREWEHPDSGTRIDLLELLSLLRDEAKRVEDVMGGVVTLNVHLLDLRPRLPIENSKKTDKDVL